MQTDDLQWYWKKSSKRKYIALYIDERGCLEIRTPMRTSQRKIEQLIIEKRSWIERSTRKQQGRIHPRLPDYAKQGSMHFMGKMYPFEVVANDVCDISLVDDKVFISCRTQQGFEKLLVKWYKQQTQSVVHQALQYFSPKLTNSYGEVGFRRYKRRWGSCDRDNNLMFNSLLALHDEKYIYYVVAHELAHIKQKNHAPMFYAEGERILPGFKTLHKEMRDR